MSEALRSRLRLNRERRGAQLRHWSRRAERFNNAISDGWSTYWISQVFEVESHTVRMLRGTRGYLCG